MLSQTYKMHI